MKKLMLINTLLFLLVMGCKKEEPDALPVNNASGDIPCYSISHIYFILDSCKINNSCVYLEHHTYSDYITFTHDGSFDFELEIMPPYTSACPEQVVEAVIGAKVIAKYITHFNKDSKMVISGHVSGKKGDQVNFHIQGHGKSLLNPYSWIKVN